jgi:hypothetical protein
VLIAADGEWLVTICTSEAIQNATPALTVYADEGCSGSIVFGTLSEIEKAKWFQLDSVDEFKVNLRGLRRVYKVRVELIPDGPDLPSHSRQPHWRIHEVSASARY